MMIRNKILFLLSIALISCIDEPNSSDVKITKSAGLMDSIRTGKSEWTGLYKDYYENGVLESEYKLIENKIFGMVKAYHSNGNKKKIAYYFNSKVSCYGNFDSTGQPLSNWDFYIELSSMDTISYGQSYLSKIDLHGFNLNSDSSQIVEDPILILGEINMKGEFVNSSTMDSILPVDSSFSVRITKYDRGLNYWSGMIKYNLKFPGDVDTLNVQDIIPIYEEYYVSSSD